MNSSKKIGLTGGIGSGKSTVSNRIREKGFTVLDADIIARQIVEPGEPAFQRIVEKFGIHILQENGKIDRKKLGDIVFRDEAKRKLLNQITHKEIHKVIVERLNHSKDKLIFVDVALLFEANIDKDVDEVWLVSGDKEEIISRVIQRDGLSREEILNIMNKQMSDEEKRSRANVIIENIGSKESLYQIVDKLLKEND